MAVAATGIMVLAVIAVLAIVGVVIALLVSKKQPVATKAGSYFDGGYFGYIGYSLLVGFVTLITLGIAFPWMCCVMERWKAKHTVVCGKRQYFDGTGIQLIGKFLLWSFLTIITFGIYGFWMSLAIKKWVTKHTHFVGEQDDNSYFDGGILGLIGTNILAAIVLLVPFVGFAWSNVIKLKWERSHTVIDSRRLIFTGTVGQYFLKYLLWGFLTGITFGIFALFMPVKNLRLEAETTIDHEHTSQALLAQSEYRNRVQNTVSANKNTTTEFEMEGLKAGINDTTDEASLRSLAEGGLRVAQYLYSVRYANEEYTAEPFSSMLKASAEAGYAPAMCLYALTNEVETEEKNKFLTLAAQQGQVKAIRHQMNYFAGMGLAESSDQAAGPLMEQAVFFADVLEASGEDLSGQEKENKLACILRLRKIASGKRESTKNVGGIIAAVIGVVAVILALLMVAALFMPAMSVRRPAQMESAPMSQMDSAAVSSLN